MEIRVFRGERGEWFGEIVSLGGLIAPLPFTAEATEEQVIGYYRLRGYKVVE